LNNIIGEKVIGGVTVRIYILHFHCFDPRIIYPGIIYPGVGAVEVQDVNAYCDPADRFLADVYRRKDAA
jgi:hypothetical protein